MNENKPRRRANAARAAQKSAYRKSGLSRLVLMVTMMALVAVVSIGGTLAWLQASTTEVVNTFKTNDITAILTETGTAKVEGQNKETKEFQLIPGVDLNKDPKVEVESSVDCFVFVEVIPDKWPTVTDAEGNKKINYTIAPEWDVLNPTTYPNVYYQKLTVDESTGKIDTEQMSVLAGDVVTVSSALTKGDMEDIKQNGEPTLSFKAYAIQAANGKNDAGVITEFTAEEAWKTVSTAN